MPRSIKEINQISRIEERLVDIKLNSNILINETTGERYRQVITGQPGSETFSYERIVDEGLE